MPERPGASPAWAPGGSALCADPRAACGGVAYAQRLTSLHTHIAWDMDDGGYTTQAEQDGPYGANDWHCES